MKNADMPAMPLQLQEGETTDSIQRTGAADGLTKREYFAGLAMQGIVSNQEWMETAAKNSGLDASECVVKGAVNIADLLLAELEKQNDL